MAKNYVIFVVSITPPCTGYIDPLPGECLECKSLLIGCDKCYIDRRAFEDHLYFCDYHGGKFNRLDIIYYKRALMKEVK